MNQTKRLAKIRRDNNKKDVEIIRVAVTTGQKSLAKELAVHALDRLVTRLRLVDLPGCGHNQLVPHICPFKEDNNNDIKTLCTCCRACQEKCGVST